MLPRFGLGIAKGMVVTLKHFFRPWITVQYPEEKISLAKRVRGNELIWRPDLCTGCATCAKSCPQGEIEIATIPDPDGDNTYIVERFQVDSGRCVFCGFCVESCPYGALFLGRDYERASYRRRPLVMDKEALMAPGREPSAYLRPQVEAQLPEQDLLLYPKKRNKWKLPYQSR
ncbi:NuoI/complex I 23 kDa subunit family protein [Chloroflexota bacterium]